MLSLAGRQSFDALRTTMRLHRSMLSNAGAVAIATFLNGVLGFLFWWTIARFYDVSSVGLATESLSVISLICLVGDFGLETLLAGESQRSPQDAPHLASAAMQVSIVITIVLGLVYCILCGITSRSLVLVVLNFPIYLAIVFGASVQAASGVLDAGLVGALKGGLRLYRNLLFGLLKLLLIGLPILVTISVGLQATYIVASWSLGHLLSGAGLAMLAKARGQRIWYRPNFGLLHGLFSRALLHHATNVAASMPGLLMPVIISNWISVKHTGPFWIAWMLLQMASIVPAALSTVLFAVSSSDQTQLKSRLRISAIISAQLCAGYAVASYFFSGTMLSLLNPTYPQLVGNDLSYLGFCIFPMAIKLHYMAVTRIYDRLLKCALTLGLCSVIEIGSAAFGARNYGLQGLVICWLLAMIGEALVLLPTILRYSTLAVGATEQKGLPKQPIPLRDSRAHR